MIACKASAYFAQAELENRTQVMTAFIDTYRDEYGKAPEWMALGFADTALGKPGMCWWIRALIWE